MKEILYVTNVRMPTQKAHGIQMIKMCEAFAALGAPVTFYVPCRRNPIKENPFTYYTVARSFSVKKLPVIDLLRFASRLGFVLEVVTFTLAVFARFAFAARRGRVFYTREYYLAAMARALGYNVVYEAHNIPTRDRLFFALVKRVPTIITNSRGVAQEFRDRGFTRVLAYPNGIDLGAFTVREAKEILRGELDLPQEKTIALYTGHLYDWKGIDVVMEAAEALAARGENVQMVCVGGTTEDVAHYRALAHERDIENISFLGHKNHALIPRYLKAADVLLLPNVPISKESICYTSPVKLPEYMASGTPIIASDLPSIRALVGDDEVLLVPAGDAYALAVAIMQTIGDVSSATLRATTARAHVEDWTWDKRAKAVLEFVTKTKPDFQNNPAKVNV
ncbi:MAG: glycosyltransferase family 4 protein [bacterium]|nr:glycosyltransferase family 4 protein [bacterium]